MLKNFFILCLISIINCSIASILRIKVAERRPNLFPNQFTFQGALNKPKVAPTMDEYSDLILDRNRIVPDDLMTESNSNNFQNNILSLPDVLIQEIFEFLLSDYSNIRHVCKEFTFIFDQMASRIVWSNFPGGTPETFSNYPRYKMIRLAPIFIIFKKKFNYSRKDLSTIGTVYEILNYLRNTHKEKALIAISIFLKLKYIPWIYFMNFNTFEIHLAWSLGLLTIAKFLVKFDVELFLESIEAEMFGIVTAIENDHKALALFMIELVRSSDKSIISSHPGYLDQIIRKCIQMKNWHILRLIYSDHPKVVDYKIYLKELAKFGFDDGLHIFKQVARKHSKSLAHIAAAYGNLNFLKKLNEMKILFKASGPNENGETAVHVAVAYDRLDCFIYLVEILKERMDCLNIPDNDGYLPIHLAANFNKHEILLEILRRNSRYKSRNPFKEVISPLHIAVSCSHQESANILLTAFPELINFQDSDGDTVIHVSIGNSSEEMLSLLISCAPVSIIKAKNVKGNTALHVAAKNGQINLVSILLSTNYFTGLERNYAGLTPIGLFMQKHSKMADKFLDLFKMSREVIDEAIQSKRPSCQSFISTCFKETLKF